MITSGVKRGIRTLRKLFAFFERDFISWTTYKTDFTMSIFTLALGALSYGFLGQSATVVENVDRYYSTNFLTYLIIGMAVQTYINQALFMTTNTFNPWTMENVLMSPISLRLYIAGSSIMSFVWSTVYFLIYMGGVYYFQAKLVISLASVLAFIVVLLVGMVCMLGLGLIGAIGIIITKRWNPALWFTAVLGQLFSGLLFPVENLPQNLQFISYFVPQTYILYLSRKTLINGYTLSDIWTVSSFKSLWSGLPGLIIITLVCIALGYFSFKWGIDKCKREGNLGFF